MNGSIVDTHHLNGAPSMPDAVIKFTLTELEKRKLSHAAQLIREVLRSVDEYCPIEDDRLDAAALDDDPSSLLRLVALTLDDELELGSNAPTHLPHHN